MPQGDVQRRFLRFTAFSALVLISIKVNFREARSILQKMRLPGLPELSRRAWGRADLSK